MREALRVWAIVTFMILATVFQMNVMADSNASEYVKEDLNIAVHDAAIEGLDQSKLANGKVVFDGQKAYKAFVQSLENNAQLKPANPGNMVIEPSNKSFFQDVFHVVTFDLIDDSTSTFPCTYKHPLYDMDVLYSGPTIVAITETKGPRYFRGDKSLIRRAASYTYRKRGAVSSIQPKACRIKHVHP